MFGLGARSEIFRCFLAQPDTPIKSVATLATETGHTKRNVSDECEMLERAGLLAQRAKTNRFYYSLARRAEFEALIGELPGIRPHWGPLLNIARQLLTLEEAADGVSAKTLPIRLRKALSAVEDDLVELDGDADFSDVHGHDRGSGVGEPAGSVSPSGYLMPGATSTTRSSAMWCPRKSAALAPLAPMTPMRSWSLSSV